MAGLGGGGLPVRKDPVPGKGARLQRPDAGPRPAPRPPPQTRQRPPPPPRHRRIHRPLTQVPPPAIPHVISQRPARLRILPHPRQLQRPLPRPRLHRELPLGQLLLERPRRPPRVHHHHAPTPPRRHLHHPRHHPRP